MHVLSSCVCVCNPRDQVHFVSWFCAARVTGAAAAATAAVAAVAHVKAEVRSATGYKYVVQRARGYITRAVPVKRGEGGDGLLHSLEVFRVAEKGLCTCKPLEGKCGEQKTSRVSVTNCVHCLMKVCVIV